MQRDVELLHSSLVNAVLMTPNATEKVQVGEHREAE